MIRSPTWKGRSIRMVMEPKRFLSESWAASETANPAIPSPASQVPMFCSKTESTTKVIQKTTRKIRRVLRISARAGRPGAIGLGGHLLQHDLDHGHQVVDVPQDGDRVDQQERLGPECLEGVAHLDGNSPTPRPAAIRARLAGPARPPITCARTSQPWSSRRRRHAAARPRRSCRRARRGRSPPAGSASW